MNNIDATSAGPAARGVAAERGVGWLTDAWPEFMKAPGMWALLAVVSFGISLVCNMIPLLGSLLSIFVSTVIYAGLLIVTDKQRRGETAEIGDLFAVLQHPSLVKLLILAAIVLGMTVAATVVLMLFGVGGGLLAAMGGAVGGENAAIAAGMGGVMLGVLVFLALLVPILALYWFALPLVLFRDMEPWPAMRASLSGVLANIVPMLVYGVVLMVLAIVATIPFLLGWLVAMPLIVISWYISYQEIYSAEEPKAAYTGVTKV